MLKFELPVTFNVELSVAAPETTRVELNPTGPVTVRPVPTFKFPDTPTPPVTVNAPVVDDVDCVFEAKLNAPITVNEELNVL